MIHHWLVFFKTLRTTVARLGQDKATLLTLASQIAAFVRGPVSAILQLVFLTPHSQGIWYSFASLGALSVLSELGLSQVISQFVIHEGVGAGFKNGVVSGQKESCHKVISLIRFSGFVYLVIVPVATIMLAAIGLVFFSKEGAEIWLAWFLYSLGGGLVLLIGLVLAIIRGFNQVVEYQKFLIFQTIIQSVLTWALLALGFQVFSLSLGYFVGALLVGLFFAIRHRAFLSQVISFRQETRAETWSRWPKKVFPVAWRNAAGYAASYLLFQLTVPVVFQVEGAEKAGQLGMTMTLLGLVRTLAEVPFSSRFPYLSQLAAEGDHATLRAGYSRILRISITIAVLGMIAFLGCLVLIEPFSFSRRLLNVMEVIPVVLFTFGLGTVGQVGIFAQVHNDPSLFWITVLSGALVGVVMLGVYPFVGLTAAYWILALLIFVVTLPTTIFATLRRAKAYLVF